MSREPAFETTDWFMAQDYPLFWPILFWSLGRFEGLCEEIRAHYGKGTMVIYHVHWWGWIEISDIWPAEVAKPGWQVKAETVVARLLSPIAGSGPAEEEPVLSPVSLEAALGCLQLLPALQDSS